MKHIDVELTDKEYLALQDMLWINPCEAGCVWESCAEKAKRTKDPEKMENFCDYCEFSKALGGLKKKLIKDGILY